MATVSPHVSRTFQEYRLLPGLVDADCSIESISLASPLVAYDRGAVSPVMLGVPFLSAAMQSVTGPEMAIGMAQQGGLGVIFCSQPVHEQADMVRRVKRAKAGFVMDPDILAATCTVADAQRRGAETDYSIFPVTADGTKNSKLVGFVNINYLRGCGPSDPVTKAMRPFCNQSLGAILDQLRHKRTVPADELIRACREYIPFATRDMDLRQVNCFIQEQNVKFVPVIDGDRLDSMVFRKDIEQHVSFPLEVTDEKKRYLVAAAINTHDYRERVPALVDAGVDVLVVDSSQGFTRYQGDCIRYIVAKYHVPVVGGNIITAEGFQFLADAGAAAIKIGMGGGSICITQEQKGTGRGQATATLDVARARDALFERTGRYIPIISDGGLISAKDVVIAFSFGADHVMMGRIFAGADESPGSVHADARGRKFKEYWGEGSERARAWHKKRYGQNEFPEGVDGLVPYVGSLAHLVPSMTSKIRAAMQTAGCKTMRDLHAKATLELISQDSQREGGVHSIQQTILGSPDAAVE